MLRDILAFNSTACLAGWSLLAAALAAGLWYAKLFMALPLVQTPVAPPAVVMDWPALDEKAYIFEASVFHQQPVENAPSNLGPLAKRFRLAGTFFAIGTDQQARKAILDDLQTKDQKLVAEGDMLNETVQVASIQPERAILREGGLEEELCLSFSGVGLIAGIGVTPGQDSPGPVDMMNRFGKRVEDKRWVLKREALLDYYKELLNNPERLVKVFDSLKPVYQAQGRKITGYTLDMEGEKSMFAALGLKQGDIIRQVNSMPMTSQSRAEYFIHEFVKDRVNGFVLDIERDNKADRLIYLVR